MKTYLIIFREYDEYRNSLTRIMTIKTENDPETHFWSIWHDADVVIEEIRIKK